VAHPVYSTTVKTFPPPALWLFVWWTWLNLFCSVLSHSSIAPLQRCVCLSVCLSVCQSNAVVKTTEPIVTQSMLPASAGNLVFWCKTIWWNSSDVTIILIGSTKQKWVKNGQFSGRIACIAWDKEDAAYCYGQSSVARVSVCRSLVLLDLVKLLNRLGGLEGAMQPLLDGKVGSPTVAGAQWTGTHWDMPSGR